MTGPNDIVALAEGHVRRELAADSSGHDWGHVDRVRRLAMCLAREQETETDELVVELAALLHDLADVKLGGSPEAVEQWLSAHDVAQEVVDAVVPIVAGVSFSAAGAADLPLSIEGQCVRDADRLDAMGAIGIARAFAFGGHAGRALHDTLDHFDEKLLLLRDRMSTDAARRLAEHRHRVMLEFLEEIERERAERPL
jgi:uncharacterized protein